MTYRTLVALAVASIAWAQPKARYLDKKTFFQMETVAAPAISPHGSQIVFTRNLWLVGADGSRLRRASGWPST